MNDPGRGAELREVSGDPIVETRTNGDEHIAMVHGHVGFVSAMHAEHPDELRV